MTEMLADILAAIPPLGRCCITDALFGFSRPITGAYPPMRNGRLGLRAPGL